MNDEITVKAGEMIRAAEETNGFTSNGRRDSIGDRFHHLKEVVEEKAHEMQHWLLPEERKLSKRERRALRRENAGGRKRTLSSDEESKPNQAHTLAEIWNPLPI